MHTYMHAYIHTYIHKQTRARARTQTHILTDKKKRWMYHKHAAPPSAVTRQPPAGVPAKTNTAQPPAAPHASGRERELEEKLRELQGQFHASGERVQALETQLRVSDQLFGFFV